MGRNKCVSVFEVEERREKATHTERIQGLNSKPLVASKSGPRQVPSSPASPCPPSRGLCSCLHSGNHPPGPCKWEAHAAAGYRMRRKGSLPHGWGWSTPTEPEGPAALPNPERDLGSGSCLASATGEEEGGRFCPTPRSRLDVTPPRGTTCPQTQGSWWAHPTRQLFRGELLKQPWQVSKHLGG